MGSDDGVYHTELLGFRPFSIVPCSRKYKTRHFGNRMFLCLSEGEGLPTQLSPLERADLNHGENTYSVVRLTLYKDPN
jgi:hypothetical protein